MASESQQFPSTRWTLIQSLKNGTDRERDDAWDWVCRNYWGPIYCFLRASGKNQEAAEDLTQQFFQKLLTEEVLQDACAEKGKLRTYLIAVLKRLVSATDRAARAQKRGGGLICPSIDATDFEMIYSSRLSGESTPEEVYQHCWALNLLDVSQKRLRAEFEKEGRLPLFETLEPFLRDENSAPSYGDLAETLSSSPGAVRLLVHRLRSRFRELFREELGNTLSQVDDLESELQWVSEILRERM